MNDEHTYKTVKAKDVVLPDNYPFFFKGKIKRFFCKIVTWSAWVLTKILGIHYGFKIVGKKNLKKGGGIIIANHIHPLDAFFTTTSFMSKKIWITSLQSNLGLPFGWGKYIRLAAMVPIPDKITQLKSFRDQLVEAIERGEYVNIYPEAVLDPFCDHIREFKKGAFTFAMLSEKPIYPIVYTFRKRHGIRRLFGKKPLITLNVLPAYNVKKQASKNDTLKVAMDELHKIMSDYFNEYSEIKKF